MTQKYGSYSYEGVTATKVDDDGRPMNYGSAGRAGDAEDPALTAFAEVTQGEVQPPAFRDPCCALLFYLQLGTVLVLSLLYATNVVQVDWRQDLWNDDDTIPAHRMLGERWLKAQPLEEDNLADNNFLPLIVGVLSSLVIAPMLALNVLQPLYENAVQWIQTAVYMSVATNILLAVVLFASGSFWMAMAPCLMAILLVFYASSIWHRIPLAAANLKSAIASIQPQKGVAFIGLIGMMVSVVWWILWIFFMAASLQTPFMESQQSANVKDDEEDLDQATPLYKFIFFLMLLSLYWTHEVIQNVVQTTVAGTVGTFWFVPQEAVGCCSPALSASAHRSMTYSFGSICFGSFLVALIEALRALIRQMRDGADRDGGDGAILLCLFDCILGILESIAEYFNRWAFVYVGLYGYSYMDASKNVLTLFEQRGWSTIISDNLAARVLGMVSFAVGVGTGLLGALVAGLVGLASGGVSDWVGQLGGSFLLSWVLGWMLASMVLAVVGSATDAVIVLWAEAPAELAQNHPGLAMDMNEAWAQAYPDVFSPVPASSAMLY
eukprot:Nitzschia sp. Nitz4//scaffold145_size56662//31762//33411//NITZ4_006560-RA/size56662-processed-gene-0.29-mRNA-1//-1//CDS//3329536586//7337//frame0